MPSVAWRSTHLSVRITITLVMVCLCGCATTRKMGWRKQADPVLSVNSTKAEVFASINRNVIPSDGRAPLKSWRSVSTYIRVSQVPVALPASIAVQAPNHFRLQVSKPLVGGHEVDIGSNDERFWIWTKEQGEVMTASHEDITLAMDEMQMPVFIHPDWLMEVMGVKALDPQDFEMRPPQLESGTIDLISKTPTPMGNDVERVVRVSMLSGYIQEHLLQLPGGKILASATLDNYTKMHDGTEIPLLVGLSWPDARMSMTIDIQKPDVNSTVMASNTNLWRMPTSGKVVDIGQIARSRTNGDSQRQMHALQQTRPESSPTAAGTVMLTNGEDEEGWSQPVEVKQSDLRQQRPQGFGASRSAEAQPGQSFSVPDWAK